MTLVLRRPSLGVRLRPRTGSQTRFQAGDADRLARHIQRLVADAPLRNALAARRQATAKALFDLRRMVNDIEAYLTTVCSGAPSSQESRSGRRAVD